MRHVVGWSTAAFALAVLGSCSESTPQPLGGGSASATLDAPNVPCLDTADAVYGEPGPLSSDPSARGSVAKCTRDPDLTKEALGGVLTAHGYKGRPLTSDARVYRISYRTQRGDTLGTPAVSSAIVYVPATPRAAKLPLVVASPEARGPAARCAASKFAPSLEAQNDDAHELVYSLVGSGFAVIMPDLAGYADFGAPGNSPSGFAAATDAARSILDGSRALATMFPVLDRRVLLVGHGQGGHGALAALAAANTYGAAGPVLGVAVYAPPWLNQRAAGAVLAGHDAPLATSAAGTMSVWYHYTHAELLDGSGEGKKLFAADKQAAIEAFMNGTCAGADDLARLGTDPGDLFDPAFVSDVAAAAAGGECANDRCKKWVARYLADRPHIDAPETPILLAYGRKDERISPNRMKCALDRLAGDHAALTVCIEPDADHGGIVAARSEYVADWFARLALGGAAPAACPESVIDEVCASPPPND